MAMSERSPALTYLYITFYSRAQRFYVLRRTRCTLCAVRREIVVLAHVYHFQFRLKYYRNFLIYIALDLLLQIWCRLMDEIFRLTLQQRWKLAVTKVANWQKKTARRREAKKKFHHWDIALLHGINRLNFKLLSTHSPKKNKQASKAETVER